MVSDALAKRPPYTQNAASSWLRKGVRDVDVLWGLSEALGVRFAWLALGEGDMTEKKPEPTITLNPRPDRLTYQELKAEAEAKAKRVAGGAKVRKPR